MTQYKIQVGSWTKLPNGQVQEDTRDIMEMMADKVGGNVENIISRVGSLWHHIGVAEDHFTLVYDNTFGDSGLLNKYSLFIPYEELQKMLNTPAEQETQHVSSLINTKLDCRKADGSVDEELSRAFQEACFEQGFKWWGSEQVVEHIDAAFLFADDNMCLYYEDLDEDFFNECNNNKQINFTYSRKLEWEATVVEPVTLEPADEMVDICGVEYSAKELSEALALIKAARK